MSKSKIFCIKMIILLLYLLCNWAILLAENKYLGKTFWFRTWQMQSELVPQHSECSWLSHGADSTTDFCLAFVQASRFSHCNFLSFFSPIFSQTLALSHRCSGCPVCSLILTTGNIRFSVDQTRRSNNAVITTRKRILTGLGGSPHIRHE